MMERGLVSTSASSFNTLGWISSGPIDFSSQSSLVSQAGLLPRRLVFRHLGTARSCAFRTSSLKNVQPSWTPLPIRAASQGTLSTSLLNRLKSALRKSKNHRITESYRLEKTFKIIESNHKPNTAKNHHYTMSLSTSSKRPLNTSRDGDSTTSLGSLFQCLITLSVKKNFLISSLNLPWRNLRPFPLVLVPLVSSSASGPLPWIDLSALYYSLVSNSASW
ncbi:hypothetical protein QYF61_011186, partial [Mycteria americana]